MAFGKRDVLNRAVLVYKRKGREITLLHPFRYMRPDRSLHRESVPHVWVKGLKSFHYISKGGNSTRSPKHGILYSGQIYPLRFGYFISLVENDILLYEQYIKGLNARLKNIKTGLDFVELYADLLDINKQRKIDGKWPLLHFVTRRGASYVNITGFSTREYFGDSMRLSSALVPTYKLVEGFKSHHERIPNDLRERLKTFKYMNYYTRRSENRVNDGILIERFARGNMITFNASFKEFLWHAQDNENPSKDLFGSLDI